MKSLYYFSKKKLQFVEIRNYHRKLVFIVAAVSIFLSLTIFGSYFFINEIINPTETIASLENENKELKNKLDKSLSQLKQLDKAVTKLSVDNNDLRLAVNLDPLTDEQRNIGVGGSVFNNIIPASSSDANKLLSDIDLYLDDLSAKVTFETNNFKTIKNKLEENEKLYKVIPALKPSSGPFGDKFGMRFHPILKIKRMHNGLDILSNTGTPVYSPGDGKVTAVKRKGGLGKTIEIKHGFGYTTVYGHLSKYKVKKGQKVKRGDLLGFTGSSGRLSTGPHLHYEIRHNGIALNPRNFIYEDVDIFDISTKLNIE